MLREKKVKTMKQKNNASCQAHIHDDKDPAGVEAAAAAARGARRRARSLRAAELVVEVQLVLAGGAGLLCKRLRLAQCISHERCEVP